MSNTAIRPVRSKEHCGDLQAVTYRMLGITD